QRSILNDTLTASPDPFAASLAGRKLGRYEVLARLASGGMAGVYVARAIGVAGFERLFAIKVLHPHLAHEEEFISMFLDEARLAARIRHPNVVPTLDISDTPDAGFYLVMEYIEGDHLGALLQKAWKLGKRLPFPVTLRIVVDALEGLAAAHNLTDESGRNLHLVHRDISPHNVMVSSDGVARITDFGVAKAEVRLSTTREGQFKGKLAYMAPEHASNGDADQRSDLFSMAIILWESLAGRRLFRAENHAATLNKICLEPIPLLSSVDAGLTPFDALLMKALARDPNDRFQSAEEFAEAIEETASTLGGIAKAREVAGLVREYAAEKLSRDTELIRSAIAQLTASGGASEPPPAMDHVPSVVEMPLQDSPLLVAAPQNAARPSAGQGHGMDYAELDISELEQPKNRRMLWITGVVLLAAAAGAGAALWSRRAPSALTMPTPTLQPSVPAEVAPPTSTTLTTPTTPAPNTAGEPTAQTNTEPVVTPSADARDVPVADRELRHDRQRHRAEQPNAAPVREPRDGRENREPRENRDNRVVAPVVQPVQPARPRRARDAEGTKPAPAAQDILPNPYH
ncbi:MAG TPA: serine/threonine-protein kinase, partial [Polyangiales bacterium]|nr:serine/threonine-protein kinase [Polyangiales bacterium]